MAVKVGVAFPGNPSDPAAWSGTPFGLMEGLRASGYDPVAINVQPERSISREIFVDLVALAHLKIDSNPIRMMRCARQSASLSAAFGKLQTRRASEALERLHDLAGIVQIGSGYRLETELPIVTFEDMTVRQALGGRYPGWVDFSRRAFERRVKLQQAVYEQAVACGVMTPWAARSVIEEYGIPPSKVHVTGVGNNHSVPSQASRDWTQPRFLFVGRDWTRKNGAGVVRAFAGVKRDFPSARLDLVGAHPPIEGEGIFGHGALSLSNPADRGALAELFGCATTLVVPSLFEPAGIVFVEAASAGVPSICSDRGGASFLVGQGGTVVPSGNHAALSEAMRRHCDPAVAKSLGARARERSSMFTWQAVAERLMRALGGQPSSNCDEIGLTGQ